eukprot:CAMPEP_0114319992 /NCGR_PEP_ID=MMETSP0059-20121206/25640_1 /TAXON_ID=36894 /ORGANISM="Pyramimonas parkeae, Strain CCMP726" /LENGTH=112 /DNA_ID=CAMNT_0001447243 /DNA_START=410 /DNA_END=748 /DNA_ORIENTATION=+
MIALAVFIHPGRHRLRAEEPSRLAVPRQHRRGHALRLLEKLGGVLGEPHLAPGGLGLFVRGRSHVESGAGSEGGERGARRGVATSWELTSALPLVARGHPSREGSGARRLMR